MTDKEIHEAYEEGFRQGMKEALRQIRKYLEQKEQENE